MQTLLQVVSAFMTACGIGYCLMSFRSILKFHTLKRDLIPRSSFTPPVSILKPLCGLDPHAYESLRSHCTQDYPDYEIIFGVSSLDDPIVPTVERLISEFSSVSMKLVVCPRIVGLNFKISNVVQMLPVAKHEYLLINDSDISVPSDYLRVVFAPLEDSSIGIVTCLYRGVAERSLGSRLESLGISSEFVPGVLCASQLEKGIHFAMGSTLALSRRILGAIGGIEAIADYLADDYELGYRIAKSGFQVEIANCLVDHHLPRYSIASFIQHQLRWARTIRSARPRGYAGLIFTFAFPWSVIALASWGGAVWGWILVVIALASRYLVAFTSALLVLQDRQVLRDFWLLPVRDAVMMLIWLFSYTGHHVVWRGKRFRVADGKLFELRNSV